MLGSESSEDDEVTILPQEAAWRSRRVRYYSGSWSSVRSVMPEFELVPFTTGEDEPVNPFLLTAPGCALLLLVVVGGERAYVEGEVLDPAVRAKHSKSEDPSDPEKTTRVLTLMLAEEY